MFITSGNWRGKHTSLSRGGMEPCRVLTGKGARVLADKATCVGELKIEGHFTRD